MTHKKSRGKRSKTLVVMLLPAIILIGIMGLFLYLIDNQYGRPSKTAFIGMKPTRGDGVTFVPTVIEENIEIMSE